MPKRCCGDERGEYPTKLQKTMGKYTTTLYNINRDILHIVISYLGPIQQIFFKRVSKLYYQTVATNSTYQKYGEIMIEEGLHSTNSSGGNFCKLRKVSIVTQDEFLVQILRRRTGFCLCCECHFISIGEYASYDKVLAIGGVNEMDFVLGGIISRGDEGLLKSYIALHQIRMNKKRWISVLPAIIRGRNFSFLKLAEKTLQKVVGNTNIRKQKLVILEKCIEAVWNNPESITIFKELMKWDWHPKILGMYDCSYLSYNKDNHREVVRFLAQLFGGHQIVTLILLKTNIPDYEFADELREEHDLQLCDFVDCILDMDEWYTEQHEVDVVLYCIKAMTMAQFQRINLMMIARYFVDSSNLEAIDYLVNKKAFPLDAVVTIIYGSFHCSQGVYYSSTTFKRIECGIMLRCVKHCFDMMREGSLEYTKSKLVVGEFLDYIKRKERPLTHQLKIFLEWTSTI